MEQGAEVAVRSELLQDAQALYSRAEAWQEQALEACDTNTDSEYLPTLSDVRPALTPPVAATSYCRARTLDTSASCISCGLAETRHWCC